jgi:hypothetical protein
MRARQTVSNVLSGAWIASTVPCWSRTRSRRTPVACSLTLDCGTMIPQLTIARHVRRPSLCFCSYFIYCANRVASAPRFLCARCPDCARLRPGSALPPPLGHREVEMTSADPRYRFDER